MKALTWLTDVAGVADVVVVADLADLVDLARDRARRRGGIDQILDASMRRVQCVSPSLSVAEVLAPASQKLTAARPNCAPVDGQASHNTDR